MSEVSAGPMLEPPCNALVNHVRDFLERFRIEAWEIFTTAKISAFSGIQVQGRE